MFPNSFINFQLTPHRCTEMDDMMKKLNHDVQQFVAKQSTPQERREMERQRIIKLGAKPPKMYKNYKVGLKSSRKYVLNVL